MELLQQIEVKAPNNGQKSVDKQTRLSESSNADSAKNKPFEEQLNKQIDQVKEKVDHEKTEDNQQVNSSKEEVQAAEGMNNDASSVTSESVDSIENGYDNEVIEGVANGLQVEETSNSLIAALLPQEGSDLPLSDAVTQTLKPKQSIQDLSVFQRSNLSQSINADSVTVVKAAITPQQSLEGSGKVQQQISELINKTQQKLVSSSVNSLTADANTIKPLNVPVNLASSLSEKVNIQDMHYTKMLSEMPTTDVITQSTRLQQVPLTTTVSTNLPSAQNILTGPITETASGITPSSLGNTLNLSIPTNIQNPNWSQQMAQQVSYMIKGGFQQAEIKLNPAHLGPMEIKLMINDDQASINFVAQHAPVRDALDNALPRLKEMLEQQGLNLSDVDVSTQSEQQQANAESQEQGNVDSHPGSLKEQIETEGMEQGVMVNMDVNSGLSIFA